QTGIHVTTVVPGLMRTGSHLRAACKGQLEREFTWFALGATLSLLSMRAERAARQIVQVTQRGEAECLLSLPAKLLGRVHGVHPGKRPVKLGRVEATKEMASRHGPRSGRERPPICSVLSPSHPHATLKPPSRITAVVRCRLCYARC